MAQTFGDGSGSGPWSSQVIQYDAMGRAILTTNPFSTSGYGGGLHLDGPVTVPSFDHLGRVTSVTMPSGDDDNPTTTQVTSTYDQLDSETVRSSLAMITCHSAKRSARAVAAQPRKATAPATRTARSTA